MFVYMTDVDRSLRSRVGVGGGIVGEEEGAVMAERTHLLQLAKRGCDERDRERVDEKERESSDQVINTELEKVGCTQQLVAKTTQSSRDNHIFSLHFTLAFTCSLLSDVLTLFYVPLTVVVL